MSHSPKERTQSLSRSCHPLTTGIDKDDSPQVRPMSHQRLGWCITSWPGHGSESTKRTRTGQRGRCCAGDDERRQGGAVWARRRLHGERGCLRSQRGGAGPLPVASPRGQAAVAGPPPVAGIPWGWCAPPVGEGSDRRRRSVPCGGTSPAGRSKTCFRGCVLGRRTWCSRGRWKEREKSRD